MIPTLSHADARRRTGDSGGAVPSSTRSTTRHRRRFDLPFLMLAVPAIVVYVAFLVGPMLSTIPFSFTRWNGIAAPQWIGIENYARLVQDGRFHSALWHTLLFVVIVGAGELLSGLGLALALNRTSKATPVLRAVFFTPALLSTAVLSLIWGFIFNPLVGVLSQALRSMGAADSVFGDLLGNVSTALFAISLVVIWEYAGYVMVIYLAGLKSIPQEIYEAATIDGARAWSRFRFVTWPLLAPSTGIVLTISLSGNFRLFDQVLLLTGGGPAGATETAALLIYRTAFGNQNFGYSVTQSVVLVLITGVAILLQRRLTSRSSA